MVIIMVSFLRWFLALIAGMGGLFLIITSFFAAMVGGTWGFVIQILIGIALIAAALALRPR